MSRSIDERVVEMRFDNQQFERNAQTSITTLNKLNKSLKLENAAYGLENVNTAAKKIDLSILSSAVDTVKTRFSAMEIVAITALSNIANRAMNMGTQIVKSLSVDQIDAGWTKYTQKTASVQTIMNSTGKSIDEVNGYLDKLMWFSDETSYGFTDMTSALSQMTSSGGNIDNLIPMIEGIANATAYAGKGTAEFSRAIYNLNQSYSSGSLKLMDWKSLELAGVASKELKQTFIDTAVEMGIIKEGAVTISNFSETLQHGWANTRVMEQAFGKFATMTEKAYEMVQAGEVDTASEAYEILSERYDGVSVTAAKAAQEAKTFAEAIDATKDAVSSGWMKTFELIFGNYEEAKVLWTDLANTLWDTFASGSEARNEMIKQWKDLGGRETLIEAFWEAWKNVGEVLGTVKEAFRDIFPPMTAENLLSITEGIKRFSESLKVSDKNLENLKSAGKGVFSVARFLVDSLKSIFSIVRQGSPLITTLFDSSMNLAGFAGEAIQRLTEKCEAFREGLMAKIDLSGLVEGLVSFPERIGKAVSIVKTKFSEFASTIKGKISEVFGDVEVKFNLETFLALLRGLASGSIVLGVKNLLDSFAGVGKTASKAFDTASKTLGGIKNILTGVKDCLAAYQQQLKAGTLLKIAGAIAILAGSLLVISLIDPNRIAGATGAITALFADLALTMAAVSKIGGKSSKFTSVAMAMIGAAAAVAVLAGALKKIGELDWEQLGKGLVGIGGLLLELLIFSKFAGGEKKIVSTGISLIAVGAAIKILASACKDLGDMKQEDLKQGLLGLSTILAGLVLFSKIHGGAKNAVSTGVSLIAIGAAMKILASACKDFGNADTNELKQGMIAVAVGLATIAVMSRLMPKNLAGTGKELFIIATALIVLSRALKLAGSMGWAQITKSLVTLGGAMLILASGMHKMKDTQKSATALAATGAALLILATALAFLGVLPTENIIKALATIAAAFVILGVAGHVLEPIIPAILGLCGAFAIFGVAVLAFGVGIAALGAGLTAFSAGASTSLTIIVKSIIGAIPLVVTELANGIDDICTAAKTIILALVGVFAECVPAIADGLLKLVAEVLTALVEYAPTIMEKLFDFLVIILDSLATRIPELVAKAVDVLRAFFSGVIDAFSSVFADFQNADTGKLINAVLGIGIFAAVLAALNAVTALIPGALVGVAGMATVVGEIAALLAVAGALAQIPGLEWLISEGGDLLQTVLTALGKAIGGLIGGVANGISSQLPEIGTNLSNFAKNIQPFIDSVSSIDGAMLDGVTALIGAILGLTAADLLNGITSFITGSDDMTAFGAKIVGFGKAIKEYSDAVAGVDTDMVAKSAAAGKALSELAETLPNTGGLVSWLTGDNDIGVFGGKLIAFGAAMKEYSDTVAGMDYAAVEKSVVTGTTLAQLAETLPNTGGLVSWFTGDNDIEGFGKKLKEFGRYFSEYAGIVENIAAEKLTVADEAIAKIVVTAQNVKNIDFDPLKDFGKKLNTFGTSFSNYYAKLSSCDSTLLANVTSQIGNTVIFAKEVAGVDMNALTTFGQTLKTFGVNLSDYIKYLASNDAKATADQAGVDLALETANGISSRYNDFVNAGSYLVVGFISGISKYIDRVRYSARSMARVAVIAAESELQIKSPSRVGSRIGNYFGMGFVNGIGNYANKAETAGTEMARAAREGLEAASDENRFSPKITPVLDLTQMRQESSFIKEMVYSGGQLGDELLQCAQLAGQIRTNSLWEPKVTVQLSNHDMVNELRSLTSRFDHLAEAVSSMKLVLDTGALVGHTSARMDDQLGVLAMRRGRGN